MAPKFGTSGLRGLVSELTDELCARYVRAFLAAVPATDTLYVGRDLRPSSARIAAAVAGAADGRRVVDCGVLPTPALALAAMRAGAPAVMVTGSHIPADRNGLKFYTAEGEITKAHEVAITARADGMQGDPGAAHVGTADALGAYRDRYLGFFGAGALTGMRIGLWQHSTVARDLLADVARGLGAELVALGRSDQFIPVDTEAVDEDTRALLRGWVGQHGLDALISADGDADRPLVTDEAGSVIAGDILGTLTARALGADTIVTPVSSNTMIEATGAFVRISRTRIGSPYVIAAMEALAAPDRRTVGFEANGGFLLGFAATREGRTLPPLATRDAFLPILATLVAARGAGLPLSALVAALPARRTASDRAENVATEKSLALVVRLSGDAAARAAFFAGFGDEAATDLTDGLRVTFAGGLILHLRPSGNAPELRCYAEATTAEAAEAAMRDVLERARRAIG